MVNEFLGEAAHRQPAVPQTFNMASLLNELQTVPHHPPLHQQQQQHTHAHHVPALDEGEALKLTQVCRVVSYLCCCVQMWEWRNGWRNFHRCPLRLKHQDQVGDLAYHAFTSYLHMYVSTFTHVYVLMLILLHVSAASEESWVREFEQRRQEQSEEWLV